MEEEEGYFASGPHQNCREVEISEHLNVIRCEDCGNEEDFNANVVNARATAIRRIALKPCRTV